MEDNRFKIMADVCCQPGATVERDGVCFGYYPSGKERPVLLLYRKGSEEIAAELPFPESCAPGGMYAMKVGLRASQYEYNFREGKTVVTDPFAKKIVGREPFGKLPSGSPHEVRGGFLTKRYDWEDDRNPRIPYTEAVMYHLHVRGFTKNKKSGVRKKGTFAGLREKLPYISELGFNQLKLMPCYEFAEQRAVRQPDGIPYSGPQAETGSRQETAYRMNYWGYGPGFYFAPKSSYAAGADADTEFRDLVKAAHRLGMEILMEFHFTEETDVLTMGRCLTYWAREYHVDGFSVIVRDGIPAELARLPLFQTVKLICGWFPETILEENAGSWFGTADRARPERNCRLLAESNDGFMNDCRRLLKGDESSLGAFADRIHRNPRGCAVVNYITNHDGFTLADLVSYDRKYNEANQERERDGTDYNYSWNCGAEGPTRNRGILKLRMRQQKNALAMLLLAQGTPMVLAGDEFGNTQEGNNNPYCHDSELTWLGWNRLKSSQELTAFVRDAICFRKAHRMLRQGRELRCTDNQADGFPDLSYHGERAWYCDFDRVNRHVGCMYFGRYAGEKGFLYVAYNLYWTDQEFALPVLPQQASWYKVMDTSKEQSFYREAEALGRPKSFSVPARTIMILEGREHEKAESGYEETAEGRDGAAGVPEPDYVGKDKGTLSDNHSA